MSQPGNAATLRTRVRRRTHAATGLVYVLPALTFLVLFDLWPLLFSLWISLWEWDIRPLAFVGLANYQRLFQSGFLTPSATGQLEIGAVLHSLLVTIYYVLGTVPLSVMLAFVLSYLLFNVRRGRAILHTLFFLPYITSSAAVALVFAWIFHPQVGLANALLVRLGLPPQGWLRDPTPFAKLAVAGLGSDWLHAVPDALAGPSMALVVVIVFSIWTTLGYNLVIYLAGLTNIPPELYEAARLDGAGFWALLRHIAWPHLSPTTFFLVVTNTIFAFQAFSPIYVLTRSSGLGGGSSGSTAGGPLDSTLTLTVYIFRYFYERARSVGYASAVACLLSCLILALTILQFRLLERHVHYE